MKSAFKAGEDSWYRDYQVNLPDRGGVGGCLRISYDKISQNYFAELIISAKDETFERSSFEILNIDQEWAAKFTDGIDTLSGPH